MINLEKIAGKLTVSLFSDSDLSEVDKAKIEYGFSLTLGILIGFTLAVLIAIPLRTVSFTALLILSALSLRFFTGGAHCSSFDRCTAFTLLIFLPISLLVKNLAGSMEPEGIAALYLVLIVLVVVYFFFQKWKVAAAMLSAHAAVILLFYLVTGNFRPGVMLSIATGQFIQGFMATKPGGWFVGRVDNLLMAVGI